MEVAVSSLHYDRGSKLRLYARFNIPEVWIANIPDRVIHTYSDSVDGEYTTHRDFQPGDTVTLSEFEGVVLSVSMILGVHSESDG